MRKDYIYLLIKLQNIYVNVFKMLGKWRDFTYAHEKIRISICKLV